MKYAIWSYVVRPQLTCFRPIKIDQHSNFINWLKYWTLRHLTCTTAATPCANTSMAGRQIEVPIKTKQYEMAPLMACMRCASNQAICIIRSANKFKRESWRLKLKNLNENVFFFIPQAIVIKDIQTWASALEFRHNRQCYVYAVYDLKVKETPLNGNLCTKNKNIANNDDVVGVQ